MRDHRDRGMFNSTANITTQCLVLVSCSTFHDPDAPLEDQARQHAVRKDLSFGFTARDASFVKFREASVTVRSLHGWPTAPPDVPVYNPAFDVTPARLIHSIVTDRGIIEPVSSEAITRILRDQ